MELSLLAGLLALMSTLAVLLGRYELVVEDAPRKRKPLAAGALAQENAPDDARDAAAPARRRATR